MTMWSDKELQQFDRWGVPRPTSTSHGTVEDIKANMEPAELTNWRLHGNQLHIDTQFGTLVQHIPTHHIFHGMDENGQPVLTTIEQHRKNIAKQRRPAAKQKRGQKQ